MIHVFLKKSCALTLITTGILVTAHPASAQYCIPTTPTSPFPCVDSVDIREWWETQDFTAKQKSFLTMDFYQGKIIGELWVEFDKVLSELNNALVSQQRALTGTQASVMDADAANDTKRELETQQYETIREQTPSEELGRFATLTGSLAASENESLKTERSLGDILLARQLLRKGSVAEEGSRSDLPSRLFQFKNTFCDPSDNNGNMSALCTGTAATARYNKDVDVTRTLDHNLTLDLDFSDTAEGVKSTTDEQDLIALASNLYGHKVMPVFPITPLKAADSKDPAIQNYLNSRQIAAMRSVAMNSFTEIAAQKSRGATGSADFMRNLMREMGMTSDDAANYLDDGTGEPSYYAQMEVLTKKMYQSPDFYKRLMDTPANVKRTMASMKTLELAQNRDLFESMERQEMLLSLILELETRMERDKILTEPGR